MTTRHTITHADEIYRGNAFHPGYSPDGRRGVKVSHLMAVEYGAINSYDADGIVSSYVATGAYTNMLTNTASVCKGALVSSALASTVTFDVPRNILITTCGDESSTPLYVYGQDEYGYDMVETIVASGAGVTSGKKAFKVITKLTTTKAFATTVSIGPGNRIGLPFKIADKGKIISITVDGNPATASSAIVVGKATTADGTSSQNDPDVRGTIKFGTVPDNSKMFTVTMLVDASTKNKAFGRAQATAIT